MGDIRRGSFGRNCRGSPASESYHSATITGGKTFHTFTSSVVRKRGQEITRLK
jgi:hypothetical protein